MVTRRQLIGRMSAAALAAPAAALAQDSAGGTGALASRLPGITLPAGKHVVAANLTVRADILVMPGATIEVAAGRTLTLLGDFQAPIAQVFTGPGRIDMNASRSAAAYPEWWGAARNDSSRDSLPALRACVAAHPVTLLGAADYFIGDTWKIDTPHRRIWGAGKNWGGPNDATRIIVIGGDKDCVQLGFDKAPAGGMNNFLQSVDLRWMEFARSAAPRASADGGGAAGLRIRYTLDCVVEGISSDEHAVGFAVFGAVYTHLRDCHAFRSVAADRRGPASFWAFFLDGRATVATGGNASVYLIDCGASIGGNPGLNDSIGAYLQGAFGDTFLQNFETSQLATGIKVDGLARSLKPEVVRAGHGNLHVLMPIIDGYSNTAIELYDLGPYAAIDIVDPYCGPAPRAFAGIFVHQSRGVIGIAGGQVIGWYDTLNGGNGLGIFAQNALGIGINGTKVIGFRRPVSLEGCRDFTIDAAITNPGEKAGQAALSLLDCSHGLIRSRISGQAGAFPAGIDLRGGNHHLSIDATAIDRACLSGGEAGVVTGARDNSGLRPASISVTGGGT